MATNDNPYRKPTLGDVRTAAGRSVENRLPPLPPCQCGAPAQVRWTGEPPTYLCWDCYERHRPITQVEEAFAMQVHESKRPDETPKAFLRRVLEARAQATKRTTDER